MRISKKISLFLFVISTVALMACGKQPESRPAKPPAPVIDVPVPAPTPETPEKVRGERSVEKEKLSLFQRAQATTLCPRKR